MTRHSSSAVFLFLAYVLCLFVAGGCNGNKETVAEGGETPVVTIADREQMLLDQVDRRFSDSDAHYKLASLYHDQEMYDRASYHYDAAIRFDPAHRDAQAGLVKLLLDQDMEIEAMRKAELFMSQVEPSYRETLKLARALAAHGAETQALACYQQALQIQPDSAEVFRDLGFYHLDKGEEEVARSYLSRSFQLDPNQPEVAGALGRLGVEVRIPEPEKKPGLWDRIFNREPKEPERPEEMEQPEEME